LKHKFIILPVFVAVFIMQLFTVIPHHHHGMMVCIATEQQCEHKCEYGHDEHHTCMEHHDSNDTNPQTYTHCVAEGEYFIPDSHEINCKISSCALHDARYFLPLLFTPANLPDDLNIVPAGTRYRYGAVVLLQDSIYAGQICGLRAPPAVLS
jgi:hypothetical protein